MIGPGNLLGLVDNTAPWLVPPGAVPVSGEPLIELGRGPLGWRAVLAAARAWDPPDLEEPPEEQILDYFALCLAAHHATVATFVPTDVDSKIRGVLWKGRPPESFAKMLAFAETAHAWDVDAVSARVVHTSRGPFSGHDGERLSVLTGALGMFLARGLPELAERAAERIDAELAREAAALDEAARTAGAELDVARLAAILTHNVGDVDQGIGYWPKGPAPAPYRARFGRLAHENAKPYGGAFQRAARIYKDTLACEGHRNYPLRGVRGLRASRDLLLPMAPFLDEWGATVARHPALTDDDRGEVVAALVSGCQKLGPQNGYYRALAGMQSALGSRFDVVAARIPAALKRALADPAMRRQLAVPRLSFESSLRKKTAGLVAAQR